jgi:hypothetical protein
MRRRALLLVAAGLILVSAAAFTLWPRPGRVTPENFARIHPGMTRAEVRAILGAPGDSSTVPIVDEEHWLSELEYTIPHRGGLCDAWLGDAAWIEVFYHDPAHETTVRWQTIQRVEPASRSRFDKWRFRLEHQWRRWFPERIRDG